MKNKTLYLGLIITAVLGFAGLLYSYSGPANVVMENVENVNISNTNSESLEGMVGGSTSDDWNVGGDLTVTGSATLGDLSFRDETVAMTGTTTLTADTSGTTYLISGTNFLITLPAVTTAGVNYKFAVNGAIATGNVIVDSAEGDNIEGTLIVAGAVVDCAAVDQINFVTDGENIGDYFEIYSDGTQWLLGDSGVLTAAKLTCTDPS